MILKKKNLLLLISIVIFALLIVLVYSNYEKSAPISYINKVEKKEEKEENTKKSNDISKIAYHFIISNQGNINSELFLQSFKQHMKTNTSFIPIEQNIEGTFQLKYLDNYNSSKRYIARFDIVPEKSSSLAPLGILLEQSFIVVQDINNRLSLFESDISYNSNITNLLNQLLAYFQVSSNSNDTNEWQIEEKDLYGTYQAFYTSKSNLEKIDVIKQKNNYDIVYSLPNFFVSNNNIKAKIYNFDSNYIFTPNQTVWAKEIRLNEEIGLISNDIEATHVLTKFNAQIISFDEILPMSSSLEEVKEQVFLANKQYEQESLNEDLKDIYMQKALPDILEYYQELLKKDMIMAKKILVAYLRTHPEQSKNLVDYLNIYQGTLPNNIQLKMWVALATAGTKEAQDAYIYALTNSSFNEQTRYQSIGHLRFFENPSADFIDTLWDIQNQFNDNQNTTNEIFANGTLFAIATLSSNTQISSELKVSILTKLHDKLLYATSDKEKMNIITAMGNTHDNMVLDDIIPYLNNSSTNIQKEAFQALSRIPSDVSIEPFLEAYEKIDPKEQTLQVSALESLQQMTMSEEIINWATKRAFELNNTTETMGLIRLLGENVSTYPNAKETLYNLVSKPLEPKLKLEIYKYITPISK